MCIRDRANRSVGSGRTGRRNGCTSCRRSLVTATASGRWSGAVTVITRPVVVIRTVISPGCTAIDTVIRIRSYIWPGVAVRSGRTVTWACIPVGTCGRIPWTGIFVCRPADVICRSGSTGPCRDRRSSWRTCRRTYIYSCGRSGRTVVRPVLYSFGTGCHVWSVYGSIGTSCHIWPGTRSRPMVRP